MLDIVRLKWTRARFSHVYIVTYDSQLGCPEARVGVCQVVICCSTNDYAGLREIYHALLTLS